MKQMSLVFVYGTLRKGERNHRLLSGAKLIAEQAWINGELHDTGFGYPTVKENSNSRVYGEVYEIAVDQLAQLDELECYDEKSEENLYIRKHEQIFTDMGSFDAYVYFSGKQLEQIDNRIETGDWKVYRNIGNQEFYYYFAYGSCMDDERFIQQGVKSYFTDIVGKGLLPRYALRFTLNMSDGGKADIVEDNKSTVEGVVYRVPSEAIQYLYRREGVAIDLYRPAIVEIETDSGVLDKVLTFLVIDKGIETGPSKLYATEILRGGKPYLSEPYLKQLELHMKQLGIH